MPYQIRVRTSSNPTPESMKQLFGHQRFGHPAKAFYLRMCHRVFRDLCRDQDHQELLADHQELLGTKLEQRKRARKIANIVRARPFGQPQNVSTAATSFDLPPIIFMHILSDRGTLSPWLCSPRRFPSTDITTRNRAKGKSNFILVCSTWGTLSCL
jgi:hypothetical protein